METKDISNKKKNDEDGLVYAVVKEGNPKSRVRVLHRNHFLSVNDFWHLLREKATESNNSNTAIRKQLTPATAAMTVMQIFNNSFQPSTPIVRKEVPVPPPLFKTPTPLPSLSLPLLKSLFPLPSSVPPPFKMF